MSTSASRKRKGTSASDQQSDRKRLQNRISQQCFREKQATYIKHLEQFVNNVEGSDGFEFSDASKNLQLIRENHNLRESLLGMRKKLLSFGAQATSMANLSDGVLDPAQNVNHSPTYLNDDEPITNIVHRLEPTNIHTERDNSVVATNLSRLQQDGHRLDSPRNEESIAGNLNGHLDPPSDTPIVLEFEAAKPLSTDTDLSTFFAGGLVNFSPLKGLLIQKPPNASTKSPLLILESKIQNAVQQFSLQSLHNTISILPFVGDLSTTEIQQIDNQTLIDIVHLVAQAMFQGSRVGGYTLVLCPIDIAERVLVWRSNPTSENRNRIEPPFRPTVLQQRFPDHHPAIDLLYWNELRDQLILCHEEIDFGSTVYRWQLSSVIEFPEQGVAVSSLELFSYLANPAQYNLNGVVEEDVISIPIVDVTARDITAQMKELAASYGLDRFEERKLPAWMAHEYPFLDMTNIPVFQYWLQAVSHQP
ncbi:hypothetical protein N7520_003729 [Penicillium odoratum]|uniref:uncharacterized protein n=1 Tax=Penicillium odoratum TaxID=1167516 RepID=UPI002548FE19|nr:uncharacterized protein N7520_003729 [Penicillium odoratum]KAJ5769170.1 hypothetical protein N7520_003729 [Penicillium odoratum]